MTKFVVALLAPGQTVLDIFDHTQGLDALGYELAGVVDPLQTDAVTVQNDTFVVNHLSLACDICRTRTLFYEGTLIHSQQLEVSQCESCVS